MEKKLQKPYLTDYSLLIVQVLWQAHYQILLIILLKEFMKLDLNMGMMMKNVNHAESNTKIVIVVLNTNVKLTKISISLSCCCQKEYEYMDNWEKFNETLPEKEVFYNHLNMKDITDADYAHAKRVSKDFKITNLEEYHALYVQSELLLLANVFNNFQNMCLEICEVDLAHFVSAPGLAWQTALKKIKVKLELLTDIDMLLMVENCIRGGICHAIH